MALDQATIAKRYAVALFELTHDQNTDAATLAELVEYVQYWWKTQN